MYHEIIIGGVGGQGVMVIGNLLAQTAFRENLNVTYIPIYGVEKRGGHADCTVVIATEEIGSPVVGSPQHCIILNKSALNKYVHRIKPGGFLLLNRSLVDPGEVLRNDLDILAVPTMEIAQSLGNDRLANMVIIGAFVEKTKVVSLDGLIAALPGIFEERYHHLLPANAEAIRQGAAFAKANGSQKPMPRKSQSLS